MSHATGAVRFSNNEIYYCEYNGTVDVMLPKLFNTYEEMEVEWRKQIWSVCKDKTHQHQVVEIATSYAGGFSWIGKACIICKTITDYFSIVDHDEVYYHDSLPEWFPNRDAYKL
jgi:hypothetical protein